ncbi:helix-turn-helix domain-containing protein [Dactylosporangium aurantiacum]|uniref:Helix-turn-helix domain-containing protein n=1 Tax=Dactylosporangium aurantiacum TaxID=35754 RepID=A0A9Q9IJ61_9ACTN|nr:helix-turn-helix transcriptional regulator [Dactylosporangium aurantiacum]MDG6105582.1 helix-turn-helix transcriptional regulator [Dactylosporangium aurantiacum]UWZ57077.1 helix-turn-helix domain-containing protein [Dactylosporangium aurantiacum]
MDSRRQLGEFLATRRSQLRPQDVGLAGYGDRRRVPGLRREELAMLAGVSASYYARLEQGSSLNASPEVLDALARALRLDEAERRHLHVLAAGSRARPAPRRTAPERLTAELEQLVEAMGETPVVVLGRRSDVLAWNRTGHALFAGHLDPAGPRLPRHRPNMARLVFLDQHTRELYADWPAKARAVIGTLRLAAGQFPADAALSALVGELTVRSGEFAELWAAHRVKSGAGATYELRHPLVGAMTVTQQALRTEHGHTVVVATTEPGSPSRAAMALLAHSTAFPAAARHSPARAE